jgi:hypothetical protein
MFIIFGINSNYEASFVIFFYHSLTSFLLVPDTLLSIHILCRSDTNRTQFLMLCKYNFSLIFTKMSDMNTSHGATYDIIAIRIYADGNYRNIEHLFCLCYNEKYT